MTISPGPSRWIGGMIVGANVKAKLNPMQLQAVTTTEGPVLIIAGPGSGKTHTLVERVTYLMNHDKVKPDEILVATFTEKAAKEIKTRVSNRLHEENVVFNLNDMYIGTFHSICLRILEENRPFTRLKRNYRVMDQFDQQFFIYQNLRKFLEVENFHFLTEGNTRKWDQSAKLLQLINKVTEELIDSQVLRDSRYPSMSALGNCYDIYQELLEEENALDFSTIQLEAYRLLINHRDVREALREKIHYIMVDEYQDTNTIQERIVLALTNDRGNLCVVGDDDQGLYRFRGATIRNILEFPNYFPHYKEIKLNTNYRSHPNIIQFYNQWMKDLNWKEKDQSFRYEKEINPPEDKTFHRIPSVVKVAGSVDRKDWHHEVYDFLMTLKKNRSIADWNQVAFLFSSLKKQEVVGLSNYLEAKGIPVYSPRSNLFFKREEIKLMLGAYMYIFPQTAISRQWDPGKRLPAWDFYDQCQADFETALNKQEQAEFKRWADRKAKVHGNLQDNLDYGFSELFYELLQFPMFSRFLEGADGTAKDSRASRNLSIFSQLIVKFEYLFRMDVIIPSKLDYWLRFFWNQYILFLDEGGITEYEDESEYAPSGCLSFLTIHQSKGLEFPIVLVGSLDNKPWRKISNSERLLETEFNIRKSFEPQHLIPSFDFWRLYYTAFSRAQNLLVLTGQEIDGRQSCPSDPFQYAYSGVLNWRRVPIFEIEYEVVKSVNLKESYSFTSHINVYNTCPLQYKFFKEFGFAPVRQAAQIFGTAVHQTIEDVHQTVLNGKASDITADIVERWFESNYHYLSSRERVYLKEHVKRAALQQVQRYVKSSRDQWDKVIGAEVKLSLVKDQYILSGNVDLIKEENGGYEIIDFKSEKKPAPESERLRQYQHQLEVYAHLLEEQAQMKVTKMHLYYTGETESNPYLTFEKNTFSSRETMEAFDQTVQKIKDKNYRVSERPTQHCRSCDMRFYCDRRENEGKILC
jgi:DNA helicase II / ATP-dependent DNA helicase PcrA